jgi:hypothetical protein
MTTRVTLSWARLWLTTAYVSLSSEPTQRGVVALA